MQVRIDENTEIDFITWYKGSVNRIKAANKKWINPFIITCIVLQIIEVFYSNTIINAFCVICGLIGIINIMISKIQLEYLAETMIPIIESYERTESEILKELERLDKIEEDKLFLK